MNETDRLAVEKYWNNLPDYINGDDQSILCVVDTSGSMCGSGGAAAPINVAISLGMYCAERAKGAFKDHYISFSSKPQLIKIEGVDFVDKVRRIYDTNLCENTDLAAVFKMLKNMITKGKAKAEDLPDKIIVISDMEIDSGTGAYWSWDSNSGDGWTKETTATEMEKIREEWAEAGLKMPKLTYWNVDARSNNILDLGENTSYVSGMSPVIFEQVLKGVTGWELCLDKLLSDRYKQVK